MSPEQLLTTGAADARADRWALAVLAYQALTGKLPFNGETLPSLSLAICNSQYAPPSRWASGLSDGLDAWFAQAFATAPEERFDSVLVMAEAFGRAIDELDEAPPESGRRASSFPSEPSHDGESAFDEISFADEPSHVDESSEPDDADELPSLMDAPPALDSGVRDFVPDAEADQSGRRRALSEAAAARAVSPTFSGAAAALRPEPNRQRAWLTVAGVAAAAVLVLIIASFALVEMADEGEPASPAAAAEIPAPTVEALPTPSDEGAGGHGAGGSDAAR